ncbi:MAG: DEAD/DEAH box helicase, partial [Thermoanaerobaculia bacterium]
VNRLMFEPPPDRKRRCRVVYISPLKALAVDVERNLRAPLAGIANLAANRGEAFVMPRIATRTGDTPPAERARFLREPADILITTPESLYLLLTSNAREMLRGVDTVIIDEIHALVPNKRGAHLAVSLERLSQLTERPPQRIGLSATQRPLEEVARFLGGAESRGPSGRSGSAAEVGGATLSESAIHDEFGDHHKTRFRPVTIVDTGEKKQLSLTVEVPVEEMAKLNEEADPLPSGPASQPPQRGSIWPAIHPRLLELIRAHRSTLIFVNSRRLAERMAAALNELAGETLVQAHHGSIARTQRIEIEDNLKSGRLPALVATSSLELGIDMGAIDLVIQIEAPPSIASGMQRIGRAAHQVGTISEGVIFPKYRGDLVACAAVTAAMHQGHIEPTRYPRNPLDIVAQQVVAMVSADDWPADDLFATIRCAAPFAELSRGTFDGVLDMLSGLYPSDEFAELRPRITWDRTTNIIVARPGSKRVAVLNGGTIPDRGLFGVFLAGAERGSARVGELDEEMVFESRRGETFLLGASTWRIEEITHDRVLVTPAPGEPGKMPFWKGDAAERTVPFGEEIGKLIRELREMKPRDATKRLMADHDLDKLAAENLLQYLSDQQEATGAVPDDRTIVVERVLDEMGDWRVCVLTPFGGRIHAPWAMAATAMIRNELAIDVETMWSDDGFIVRFPETDVPPRPELVLPDADEVEQLVVRQLGSSSMFAAKFREAAERAL